MTTLKINEQEYPVDFRLNAARLYCREKNLEFFEFEEYFRSMADPEWKLGIDDIENIALLGLCGFRNGAILEKKECDLTIDDIVNWFSEDPVNMALIIRIYAENKPKVGEKEKNQKAPKQTGQS